MAQAVSPNAVAAAPTELWSPRVVGEVDDAYVKVAKVHGSLAWHSHQSETVELKEGEMFVVPKGVRHNPVAEEECHILLIERKTTQHTGDVKTGKTRSLAEQLRPV